MPRDSLLISTGAEDSALVFDREHGRWVRAIGSPSFGDELLLDGVLVRITEEGPVEVAEVALSELADAAAPHGSSQAPRSPHEEDWVYVVEGEMPGHWPLAEVLPGERFTFQGWIFVLDEVGGVQRTSQVVSAVSETYVRRAPTVVRAHIRFPDGNVAAFDATPDHPFYVPDHRGYVNLGDLELGTVLRTAEGEEALLVRTERMDGSRTVYNLRVEGTHNYFVGSGRDAVLVHNGKYSGSYTIRFANGWL